jgi:hypothetical protein
MLNGFNSKLVKGCSQRECMSKGNVHFNQGETQQKAMLNFSAFFQRPEILRKMNYQLKGTWMKACLKGGEDKRPTWFSPSNPQDTQARRKAFKAGIDSKCMGKDIIDSIVVDVTSFM